MPKPIQLADFGLLTDADGKLLRDEHDKPIPVATDQFTGTRYELVCRETPGIKDAQRKDATKRLTESGAVHISSEDSGVRGWWAPVVELKPAAIDAPAEPAAEPATQAAQ